MYQAAAVLALLAATADAYIIDCDCDWIGYDACVNECAMECVWDEVFLMCENRRPSACVDCTTLSVGNCTAVCDGYCYFDANDGVCADLEDKVVHDLHTAMEVSMALGGLCCFMIIAIVVYRCMRMRPRAPPVQGVAVTTMTTYGTVISPAHAYHPGYAPPAQAPVQATAGYYHSMYPQYTPAGGMQVQPQSPSSGYPSPAGPYCSP